MLSLQKFKQIGISLAPPTMADGEVGDGEKESSIHQKENGNSEDPYAGHDDLHGAVMDIDVVIRTTF